jgi:DNA topoisomerase-2
MSNDLNDYQKRTLAEQVLAEPDTFVGGSDEIEDTLPLMKDDRIVVATCKMIPAILKLFDEILVNARDQKIRLDEMIRLGGKGIHPVTEIKITYDDESGIFTIYNNGNGIDVAEHPSEKDQDGSPIWIPDLILGNLLTSKNYNKSGKTTGGKNGFGAKLVNLFSTWFQVETVDHKRKLKYSKDYRNNMSIKEDHVMSKFGGKPYTKISWKIDFERFGIEKYSANMISLMHRRVYDIAGTTEKSLGLWYNGEKLSIKSFEKYIDLYLEDEAKVYEKIHERWEVGVSVSKTDKFENYSFVNGIYTPKGGKHVDFVTKKLTSGIARMIKKKHKKDINENYIKNYLKVFVNSVIEDPSFESQSKERLITSPGKFGSKPEITDKFIKRVFEQLDIVDKVISFADFKLNKESKKTDGNKKNKIRDVPKLDDANWAGTKRSDEAILILTEGDSAKSMAVSGLSVVGRDKYGVFPLKGKVMNVKDASKEMILKNMEITNLKKIVGLESG